jgi:hypothetical protein
MEEHPEVFVIGDMAYLEGFQWGDRKMALSDGRSSGASNGRIRGEEHHRVGGGSSGGGLTKFTYFDKGSMAIVGRGAAIVSADKIALSSLCASFQNETGPKRFDEIPGVAHVDFRPRPVPRRLAQQVDDAFQLLLEFPQPRPGRSRSNRHPRRKTEKMEATA